MNLVVGKSGLSIINRVLAKQFSSSPNVKVTLFVPPFECECKEKDKAEAFKCGINIEEADGKMSNPCVQRRKKKPCYP